MNRRISIENNVLARENEEIPSFEDIYDRPNTNVVPESFKETFRKIREQNNKRSN